MAKLPLAKDHRTADHDIERIFIERWSPRAMTGGPVSMDQLNRLFEAARWAPSAFNEQPWRFLYALRDTPHWQTFFDLLASGNQSWCINAAALVTVVSSRFHAYNGKPNRVHVFDSGAAWANLALQGARLGLVVHGMAGFDVDKARTALRVPDEFEVTAMIAIGQPGDPDKLPEGLREGEIPTGRKPVQEIALEGGF